MNHVYMLNEGLMTQEEFKKYQYLRHNHPKVSIIHKSSKKLDEQEIQLFALEMYPIKEESSLLESSFIDGLPEVIKHDSLDRYRQIGNLSKENFRITFESMFGHFKPLPASYVALVESTTNYGMVDDGPAVFFKDLNSYKNRSDRFAAMLGWRVHSYTTNAELEKFDTDYPNGSGNYPVSWGPSGDVGDGVSTEDQAALEKWKINTNNTLDSLSKLGWKFSEMINNTYNE